MRIEDIKLDNNSPFELRTPNDQEMTKAKSYLLSLDDWNKKGVDIDFYYLKYGSYFYLGKYSISFPPQFDLGTLITNQQKDIMLLSPLHDKGFLIDKKHNILKEKNLKIYWGNNWVVKVASQMIGVK